jgi:hypothetical protein
VNTTGAETAFMVGAHSWPYEKGKLNRHAVRARGCLAAELPLLSSRSPDSVVLCNIGSQWQLKAELMAPMVELQAELVTAVLCECAQGQPCDNRAATH